MEEKLLNKDLKEYGESYYGHYFDQYKMYIESVEKISDRRQNSINLFLAINTIFISVLSLFFEVEYLKNLNWAKTILFFLGIIICVIFWFLIRAYKQLNSGKFKVIHEIEEKLPLSLYTYEWKILGEGKDARIYYPFSHIELFIPWVFGLIYLFLGVMFVIL